MAIIRKSLNEILSSPSDIDRAQIEATSEEDIRRHQIEDGENPDRELKPENMISPQAIRKRLDMTQEEFATALRIPLATLRNWEQGRVAPEPAARSLLRIVARDPQSALKALAN